MAISTSRKTVEDMQSTLQSTIKEITYVQDGLRSVMQSVNGWTDAQGQQYRDLMKKVARLTETPKRTLIGAVPKMERMIQALQDYEKVRF